MDVLDAFTAQARLVQAIVDGIPADRWDQPGLGEWSIAELVAHLVRAADRVTTYLDVPLVSGTAPICDQITYYAFAKRSAADQAELAANIAERSRQDAIRIGTANLAASFARAWRTTADRAAHLPADHLLDTFAGPMLLHQYAATRVLELVVHGIDLTRALQLPPAVDSGAMAVTMEILISLMHSDAPTPDLDPIAFAMQATGRDPSDDPRLPVFT